MSFGEYEQFLFRVNETAEPLFEVYASHLQCRRGCYFCCANIAVLPVEHAYVTAWLEGQKDSVDEPETTTSNTLSPGAGRVARGRSARDMSAAGQLPVATGERESSCPLLAEDGSCSVYPARPVICRVHGLPLAYPLYEYDQQGRLKAEDERMDLWCDLNFPTLSEGAATSLFNREGRIDMVLINRELEAINGRFLGTPAGRHYTDERLTFEGLI